MTAAMTIVNRGTRAPCGCGGISGGSAIGPCAEGDARVGLERTRFFPRQIITADDLTQDQVYFRERAKRHNRMLHGWGVVCGACVHRGSGPREVVVDPGYILGPYGDEIVIPAPVTLDLGKMGMRERDGCCDENLDPWCADERPDCPDGFLYLAVRYQDCQARPVRGGDCGCGCGGECQNSRLRDSYAFQLMRDLPATYAGLRQPAGFAFNPCLQRGGRLCPPCPESPWVVLADVIVNRSCELQTVDCFAHRRYVMTFADFFYYCGGPVAMGGQAKGGGFAGMHALSFMTGSEMLLDVAAAERNDAPLAMVTLARGDGTSVTLPAYFEAKRDETVGNLLDREGNRRYYEPSSGTSYTLRDIYAGAGIDENTRLSAGATGALAPFEGKPLELGERRDVRIALDSLLAPPGLEWLDHERNSDPTRAGDVAAKHLRDVGEGSPIAATLGDMTVRALADTKRDEFIARASDEFAAREGVLATPSRRVVMEREAGLAYDRARTLVGIADRVRR